jgi:hypothetical protein
MSESYRDRVTTTTSLRQGRLREEGSEGSQRQLCEPTNRNVIEGRVSGVSQHNMPKPNDPGDTVNDAVVQGQFTFLSGEVCSMAICRSRGAGLRCIWKRMRLPPDPTEGLVTMGVGLRPIPKGLESPPNPTESQIARSVVTLFVKLDRSQQRP